MASWWEPEKAVKTRSPTYGWRGWIGSWVQCSKVRATALMSEKSRLRIDALRVHVEGEGDEIDVAGALAVAEEAALDAVGAGHEAELGGGDGGAAVIVRVEADEDAVAAGEVLVHPLDLVGVDVGRGDLDRGREIEDDLALQASRPRRR